MTLSIPLLIVGAVLGFAVDFISRRWPQHEADYVPRSGIRWNTVVLVVTGAAVFAITISRPEVGLAAWFVMIPAGELGFTGRPHWLLPSVWAALLCGLAAARAATDDEPAPPLVLPVLCFSALTVVQGLALTTPTSAALASIRMAVVGTMIFYATATLVRTRSHVLWVIGALAALGTARAQ